MKINIIRITYEKYMEKGLPQIKINEQTRICITEVPPDKIKQLIDIGFTHLEISDDENTANKD